MPGRKRAPFDESRAAHREAMRLWYQKNREAHLARALLRNRKRREEWKAFKATLSCARCGISHPAVIDFHHEVRDETSRAVSEVLKSSTFTAAMLEAAKCIPLCANCHRITHHEESQARRRNRRKKAKGGTSDTSDTSDT